MTDLDLMLRFMLQVLAVLGACKVIGYLGVRFLGQAQVTMEMVAGVMLGPSLFGLLAPEAQNALFPLKNELGSGKHPSMMILYIIAQIGLVLYMFLVGAEFDLNLIKGKSKAALSISGAGILFPFLFGVVAYYALMSSQKGLFGENITDTARALYLGAAMCITAFPMLARIIYEAGFTGTRLGALALGSGATDDAAAWSILAVVLAQSKGDPKIAIFAIGGGILFVTLMLTLGKASLAKFLKGKTLDQTLFMFIILLVFAGAWFTDAIGVYAVFGAFTLGAAMPKGELTQALQAKIEPLTVGLFLPFFFVYSGLNTKLSSIQGAEMWGIALAVLIAAIAGKLGGCYLAARLSGERHTNALGIGILMNSRGLMELIILNIGLQSGVITQQLFSIMVVMAVVTTLMAAPLFKLIKPKLILE
jgi:Kef-type K+ transport system membrane component KefB